MKTKYLFFILIHILFLKAEASAQNKGISVIDLVTIKESHESKILINKLLRQNSNNLNAYIAKGIWLRNNNNFPKAINHFQNGIDKFKSNKELIKQKLITLELGGLYQPALELVVKNKNIFNQKDINYYKLLLIDQLIRWERKRTSLDDQVNKNNIRKITQLIRSFNTYSQQLEVRKILLCILKSEHSDAIAKYKRINNHNTPLWFRAWIAESYYIKKEYNKALNLLKLRTNEVDTKESLSIRLKTLAASGSKKQFYKTYNHFKALVGPEYLNAQGLSSKNWERLYTDLESYWFEASSGNYKYAIDRLTTLVEKAPLNTSIREQLSETKRWQGQTNQSIAEYKKTKALNPKSSSTHIGLTNAYLDNFDFKSAFIENKNIKVVPRKSSYIKVQDRFRLLNSNYIYTNLNFFNSGPNNKDLSASFGLESKLISYNLPLQFILSRHQKSEQQNNINNKINWSDLGLKATLPLKTQLLAIGHFPDSNTFKNGFSFQSVSTPVDGFNLGMEYKKNDYNLATYILKQKIVNDTVALKSHITIRENINSNIYYKKLNYSDTNNSELYSIDTNVRLNSHVNRNTWLHFGVNSESYSLKRTNYFSPEQKTNYNLSLKQSWINNITFLKQFENSFEFGTRLIEQKDYKTQSTLTFKHDLSLELKQGTKFNLNSAWAEDSYDGQKETAFNINLNISVPMSGGLKW